MGLDPVNIVGLTLYVDLDEAKGLQTLKECITRSHASPTKFARLMGVTRGCMSLWLSGKRPVTPLAIRAALYCAAMSGVPRTSRRGGIKIHAE